jgi:hypothetical protein
MFDPFWSTGVSYYRNLGSRRGIYSDEHHLFGCELLLWNTQIGFVLYYHFLLSLLDSGYERGIQTLQ